MIGVFTASMYPIARTLELFTSKELTRIGPRYLVVGVLLLAVPSTLRRDWRRLGYLAGPCLLFVYTLMLAVTCFGILLEGGFNSAFFATMLVAAMASLAIGRWIAGMADDPEPSLGARRPTSGCS
jgi:hypothetical protein